MLDPDRGGDTGVPGGAELLGFADAVQIAYAYTSGSGSSEAGGLPEARAALQRLVGLDGLLEAAGTIAVFNGLVRVADGTGIPLDTGTMAASADFRASTGINGYAGAANTTVDPAPRPWSSVSDLFT